ncbi:FMN-binding protein [Scardovia inopinata]|uniref:FMN-binding protein n=1 Tax=Scardovia inopinata TaxID=78259 RepID=UPI002F2B3E72
MAITVSGQKVSQVTVTPHPATPISKKYQTGFVKEIKSAIVGKPLKNLKVSKVAGASWTSDAFNKALEVVRQEASTAAGRH